MSEGLFGGVLTANDDRKRYFVDDVNEQHVPKLAQPKSHKAKISVWTDLSINDVDILSMLTTADHIRVELAHMFNLHDEADNPRSAILLDLYYYTIRFAMDNNFSKEQMSAFFSIVKKTHEVCIETPFGNVENCFVYFKDMVLCHAVKRPPFSIDLFSADDVRKITEYVINTYFRHYKLYKYTFTPRVTLDLSIAYLGMPPTPPPEVVMESDQKDANEENQEQVQDEVPGGTPEIPPEDEAAVNELRKLIRQHLSEELKRLRLTVDQQIKASEDTISKRINAAEAGSKASTSGKDTSHGKAGKKK